MSAERFGGLVVDHELKFGRRLNRKISGFCAFEDAINVVCSAPELVEEIRTVRHQPAAGDEITVRINRGQLVAARQCGDEAAVPDRHAADRDDEFAAGYAPERRDATFDFGLIAHSDRPQVQLQRRRCDLHGRPHPDPGRVALLAQDADAGHVGRDFLQQLKPFDAQFVFERCKAGCGASGLARLSTRPAPTGSVRPTNTIGTVRCAFCIASTLNEPVASTTSGENLGQLRRGPARGLGVGLCCTSFVTDVLPFHPAQLLHLLQERGKTALLFRVRVDEAVENTDTPDTLWLRARGCGGERRRAAEFGNECPPPHAAPQSLGSIRVPGQIDLLKWLKLNFSRSDADVRYGSLAA